jgi:hypothetical protein
MNKLLENQVYYNTSNGPYQPVWNCWEVGVDCCVDLGDDVLDGVHGVLF